MKSDAFARLGAFVYARRWYVIGAWALIFFVAAGLASKTNGVLKAGGVQAIGSESEVASRYLESEFHASALNNVVVVFHSDTRKVVNPAYEAQVKAAAARVRKAKGVTRVLTYYGTVLPQFLGKDKRTTLMLVSLKGNEGQTQTYVQGVRKAVGAGPLDLQHYVTGWAAVNHDFSAQSEKDVSHAEIYTFSIVLLLLLVTFGTVVSAALPLVLGGATVVTATGLLYIVGRLTDTSTFALNIASMIGLGLAIDFSLIVVNRFREELARTNDPERSVVVTMGTAGRSILYSGLTVILGIVTLMLLVNLNLIRSISFGVVLVAAMALLAGLTLLPALLGVLAHRVERLRVLPKRAARPADAGFWYRWSKTIMRRPGTALLAGLAVIVVLCIPVAQLKLFGSTAKVLPAHAEAAKGADVIDAQFVENSLDPIQIVIRTNDNRGIFKPKVLAGIDRFSNTLAADPRVASAGVSSLSTYMAAEPRDGRYQHLKPVWDFWPAPAGLAKVAMHIKDIDSIEHPLPGVDETTYVDVWAKKVAWSPAYMGWAKIALPGGFTHALKSSTALQVYRVLSGHLAVSAARATTYWSAADFGKRYTSQTIAAGHTVTLGPRAQLLVPAQTRVRLRTGGAPVKMLAVVQFRVRPGPDAHDSWLSGPTPVSDPLQGIRRQIEAGGIGATFPRGATHILLQDYISQPGARYPRHIHFGPELIYNAYGQLTVFASPEMVITGANGRIEEGKYDTPTPLSAKGMALVQGFGIHRAVNTGKGPESLWSLKFIDPRQPELVLVALRDVAKSFVNLDRGSNTAVVNVVPRYGPYDPRTEALVGAIRSGIVPSVPGLRGTSVYVGGTTATFLDFRHALYGRFPYVVGAVFLLTFAILLMFFQSVFLPLKAILMNLASLLATFGVLVLIFQHGWGSGILGFQPQGALSVITPAILFVILFGLSTDYEVFMLSRIKEYYAQSGDNEESVAAGLQQTGRIVTAAGLILIGVFGSFATAGIISIKEIGLGLAIGVAIDTIVIRSIVVPATMRLAGSINWVMPAWADRFVPKLREGPDEVPVPTTTD